MYFNFQRQYKRKFPSCTHSFMFALRPDNIRGAASLINAINGQGLTRHPRNHPIIVYRCFIYVPCCGKRNVSTLTREQRHNKK